MGTYLPERYSNIFSKVYPAIHNFVMSLVLRRGLKKETALIARMLFACLFFVAVHFFRVWYAQKCYANLFF